MRTIRVITICYNEDDHRGPHHRRIRMELCKKKSGYSWYENGMIVPDVYTFATVQEAMEGTIVIWGARDGISEP